MNVSLRASLIINTFNRVDSLRVALESLRYLDYNDFEVIVVNGPSDDGTDELLEQWSGEIKIGHCDERNLSASRNVGIAMSAGDIVVFMDDDAIPEPEWLSRLMAAYDSREVGAAGGFVFDHTGYNLQYKYSTCNRLGNAKWSLGGPSNLFNFPNSFEIPYINASFRRSALLEIGGFDEEYDYYLDESDVCMRLVDKGYLVKELDDAFLHHKSAPSSVRTVSRIVTNWYSIIKNKIYFSFVNTTGTSDISLFDILRDALEFIEVRREEVNYHIKAGNIGPEVAVKFHEDANQALREGILRGMSGKRRLIDSQQVAELALPFQPFPTLKPENRQTVCFLSQTFPPGFYGGIARFTSDMAKGMARRGHHVHVITCGEDHNTVDFEEGVWVHRILPREFELPDVSEDHPVCRRMHNYSKTVLEEIRRIESHHRVDIIGAPVWDSEGLYCVLDEEFRGRTVVSLQTTMRIAASSYPTWQSSPDIREAIATETTVLNKARALLAISRGILDHVVEEYGVDAERKEIGLIPLGVKDPTLKSAAKQSETEHPFQASEARADKDIRILFVGRLEMRKGVDVLLSAIPKILDKYPEVRMSFVGNDAIPKVPDVPGPTYKSEFLAEHEGKAFLDRIEFLGHVTEEELHRQYAGCDIFVAPSRYESFGLIFLEAMAYGKPVIGCRTGGVVEVIEDGGNGLLITPGDIEDLQNALESLIRDPARRERMGYRSRQIFEEQFTDDIMVGRVIDFFYELISDDQGSSAEKRSRLKRTTEEIVSRNP